jgi:hypothetical protein
MTNVNRDDAISKMLDTLMFDSNTQVYSSEYQFMLWFLHFSLNIDDMATKARNQIVKKVLTSSSFTP